MFMSEPKAGASGMEQARFSTQPSTEQLLLCVTGSGIFCLHNVLCSSGASNAIGLGEAFEVMRQFLSHTKWLVQILSRLIIFSCFISLIGRWKYSHCVHRKPEALWLWLVSINSQV